MGAEEKSAPKSQAIEAVWGVPLTAVHCATCGEAHLVPQALVPQPGGEARLRCPFCLQKTATPQPTLLREEPPEQVLPYQVSPQQLAGTLERWAKGIWFRPTDLKADTLAKRAQRYLVPLWLVDGHVEATWRADVGFDYQVVSYQDRYRDGAGWSSQEVKETRVRWEPRVGRLDRVYENVAAPALDDHRQVMSRLGNFDLSQRDDYAPQAANEAAVRIPTLDPQAAWPGAEAAFVRTAQAECQQASGADHIRDFTIQAAYSDPNWTLLLLPAFVTWYEEGEQVWPVLVNGQSGHVSGAKRASARKANVTSLVLGAIALVLFLLGGALSLLGAVLPPIIAVGGVILLLGVLLAVAAPIPAISVWVFNRRSSSGPE
jgi:hypothetical protein